MAANAPPKTTKKTWLEGLSEDFENMPTEAMYTREEVLGSLHDRGVDINEGTLISLEKANILPRPVRRYRDGAPRAMYPQWAVDAIEHARQLQAKGMTRAQIAPVMHMWSLGSVLWQDPYSAALTIIREEALGIARHEGLDVARIRISFLDDNGQEIGKGHEILIPDEWRPTNKPRTNWPEDQ